MLPRRSSIRTAAWLLAVLLGGCASNGDDLPGLDTLVDTGGVEYTTELRGAPSADTADVLERSLRLFTLADRPPPSLAQLRRRAEGDVQTAVRVLRAEGFYAAQASWRIDEEARPVAAPPAPAGPGADSLGPGASAPAPEPSEPLLRVVVDVEPGVRFQLGRFDVSLVDASGQPLGAAAPDLPGFEALGIATGGPARSADILAAESEVVAWLREHGYPQARQVERDAAADLQAQQLRVSTQVAPGPRARLGALRFQGLESVREEFLRRAHGWPEGELYAQSELDALQRDLASTGLFEHVSVEAQVDAQPDSVLDVSPAALDAAPALPVEVTVQEAAHRSVGGGLRYSTDTGPSARGFFEHRNLFGAGERARLDATVALPLQELSLTLRKPAFQVRDRALVGGATLRRAEDDAFDEVSASASLGLEQRLSERSRVSGGVSVEAARFTNSSTEGTSFLLGLPLGVNFDNSDDLLDPTRGYRAGAALTPYVGTFDGEFVQFGRLDVNASTYFALDESARYVLALRGRAGSVVGASRDDLPPSKRFYSGGGGSVRGYQARFIGPLDAAGDPVGGRSVLEAGMELRVRIGESLGVVPFIEAGTVSPAIVPDLDAGVQVAAGLGLRYYTAIGPVRADVGVPLNGRPEDDAFQFYISIGQAF